MGGTLSLEQQAHDDITSGKSKISHSQKIEAVHQLNSKIIQVSVGARIDIQTNLKTCTSLLTLISSEYQDNSSTGNNNVNALLAIFLRLLFQQDFYKNLRRCNLEPILNTLQSSNFDVVNNTLDCIMNMLKCGVREVSEGCFSAASEATKEDPFISNLEQGLKETFHTASGFEKLGIFLEKYQHLAQNEDLPPAQQNVIWKTLDIFQTALLARSYTSSYKVVSCILSCLKIDTLLDLSISKHVKIRTKASLVIQGLLLHSDKKNTNLIQILALNSVKFLWYMYFSINKEGLVEHQQWHDEPSISVYRDLVGLLCDDSESITMTIQHALPKPMFERATDSSSFDPHSTVSVRLPVNYTYNLSKSELATHETVRWVKYSRGNLRRSNWHHVFNMIDMPINTPLLVWSTTNKHELLETLVTEMEDFKVQVEINPSSVWDHEGFEVVYESLQRHLTVGPYYAHLLLPLLEACFDDNPHTQSLQHVQFQDPTREISYYTAEKFKIPRTDLSSLVSACFQRAVVEDNIGWKLACLRVMSALYAKYSSVLREADMMPYLIWLLTPKNQSGGLMLTNQQPQPEDSHKTSVALHSIMETNRAQFSGMGIAEEDQQLFSTVNNPLWRDHIIRFLKKLFDHTANINRFVASDGVSTLLYYINDVHRSTIHPSQARRDPTVARQLVKAPADSQITGDAPILSSSNSNHNSQPSISSITLSVAPSPSNTHSLSLHTPTSPMSPMSPTSSHYPPETPKDVSRRVGRLNRHYVKDDLLTGVAAPHSSFEVALRCLKLLSKIVHNAPRLRKGLFKERVLVTLIQLLVIDDTELRDLALSTLMKLIDSNTHVIPQLASTGAFLFIFYAVRGGRPFTESMAKFISKYHLRQSVKFTPKNTSILLPYLPSPLVDLTCTEDGAFKLRDIFAENTVTPLLYWDHITSAVLTKYVEAEVEPFIALLHQQPYTVYSYTTPVPVSYDTLNRELFVGDVYVRLFNSDGVINDLPNSSDFLDALVKEMKKPKYFSHMDMHVVSSLDELVIDCGDDVEESYTQEEAEEEEDTVGELSTTASINSSTSSTIQMHLPYSSQPQADAESSFSIPHIEEHLVDLMKAQITLCKHFREHSCLVSYAPLDELMCVLNYTKDNYSESNLLYRTSVLLFKTVISIGNDHSHAVNNSYKAVAHNAVSLIINLITRTKEDPYMLVQLFSTLHTLLLAGKINNNTHTLTYVLTNILIEEASLMHDFFVFTLSLLDSAQAIQKPHLATIAIRCLLLLSQHCPAMSVYILKYGFILDIILLALTEPFDEEDEASRANVDKITSMRTLDRVIAIDEDSDVRLAATQYLAFLYSASIQQLRNSDGTFHAPLVYSNTYHSHDLNLVPSNAHMYCDVITGQEMEPLPLNTYHAYMYKTLVCSLTPGLCALLSQPTAFMKAASSFITSPVLIWDTTICDELTIFLQTSIEARNSSDNYSWSWGVEALSRVSGSTQVPEETPVEDVRNVRNSRQSLPGDIHPSLPPTQPEESISTLDFPFLCKPLRTEIVVQGVYVRAFIENNNEQATSVNDILPAGFSGHGFLEGLSWALHRLCVHAADEAHVHEWDHESLTSGLLTISSDPNDNDTYAVEVECGEKSVYVNYSDNISSALLSLDYYFNWSMKNTITILAAAIAKLGSMSSVLIKQTLDNPDSGLVEMLHLLASSQPSIEIAVLHAFEVFANNPQTNAFYESSLAKKAHPLLPRSKQYNKGHALGAEQIIEYAAHDLHYIIMRDAAHTITAEPSKPTLDGSSPLTYATPSSSVYPSLILALDVLAKLVVVQTLTEKAALLQRFWENGVILSLVRIISGPDAASSLSQLLSLTHNVAHTVPSSDLVDVELGYQSEYAIPHQYSMTIRLMACKLLGLLIQHPIAGRYFSDSCHTLLTPNFHSLITKVHLRPVPFITTLFTAADTPGFYWSNVCVNDMKVFVQSEVQNIRTHHENIIFDVSSRRHAEARRATCADEIAEITRRKRLELQSDEVIEREVNKFEDKLSADILYEISHDEFKRVIVGNTEYISYQYSPTTWDTRFTKNVLSGLLSVHDIYIFTFCKQLNYKVENESTFVTSLVVKARDLMSHILWGKNNIREAESIRALDRNKKMADSLRSVRKPVEAMSMDGEDSDSDSYDSDEDEAMYIPSDEDMKTLYAQAKLNTRKLSAVLFTLSYMILRNPTLIKDMVGDDNLAVLTQFCVLECDLEDINLMLGLAGKQQLSSGLYTHYGPNDNQHPDVDQNALKKLLSSTQTTENTLIVQVLTIMQIVSESLSSIELIKQRVLRFVLPLTFFYFDYYMFQFGDETLVSIPTPITMSTSLSILDNLLVNHPKEASYHLVYMGSLLYLYNILLQTDICPPDVLHAVILVLQRLANTNEDSMLAVLQFLPSSFIKYFKIYTITSSDVVEETSDEDPEPDFGDVEPVEQPIVVVEKPAPVEKKTLTGTSTLKTPLNLEAAAAEVAVMDAPIPEEEPVVTYTQHTPDTTLQYKPLLPTSHLHLPTTHQHDASLLLPRHRLHQFIEALTSDVNQSYPQRRKWDQNHRDRLFEVLHTHIPDIVGVIAEWSPSAGRAFDVRALDAVWTPFGKSAVARILNQYKQNQEALKREKLDSGVSMTKSTIVSKSENEPENEPENLVTTSIDELPVPEPEQESEPQHVEIDDSPLTPTASPALSNPNASPAPSTKAPIPIPPRPSVSLASQKALANPPVAPRPSIKSSFMEERIKQFEQSK